MTKKEFEQLLNEKYGVDTMSHGQRQFAARTRPYGTYLRASDPEKFVATLAEYLETGEF